MAIFAVRRPVSGLVLVLMVLGALAGCASSVRDDAADRATRTAPSASGGAPDRFTIRPDDYHVPYAGTAEDGHKFFLSDELFTTGGSGGAGAAYVGLFLWRPDGTFDEVHVHTVPRPRGLPPAQASSAGRKDIVESELAGLGDYVLEPIRVEPFTTDVDGVSFGWEVDRYAGTYFIRVVPGDFIAYYAPWDGRDYGT